MQIDETKISIEDADLPRKKAKKKESKNNFIENQSKERSYLVKLLGGLGVFVVVVFVLIFAVKLLRGDSIEDSLEVFNVFQNVAVPIIMLVLGYYFGSKDKK